MLQLKVDQSQNLAHTYELVEGSGQSVTQSGSMWCGRSGLGREGFIGSMADGGSYQLYGLRSCMKVLETWGDHWRAWAWRGVGASTF